MSKVVYAISVSLDGFVAGADDDPDRGMGRGGVILHQWAYQPDETDSRILTEGIAGLGAHIVGRQALQAGLVDRVHIQLAPVLLGAGVRLIDQLSAPITLRQLDATPSANTVHLGYEVVR